jgi:hypothetical protein
MSFSGIPILMFAWGLVTMAHALIKDKAGYLTVRVCKPASLQSSMIELILSSVIAITEGGVIPATLIYLGGFYKSTELSTRLGWFWGVQVRVLLTHGLAFSFIYVGDCKCGQWAHGKRTTPARRKVGFGRMEVAVPGGALDVCKVKPPHVLTLISRTESLQSLSL